MRVEIHDANNVVRRIDTQDAALVAGWFAEQCPALMSANSRLQWARLCIWPETDDELNNIGRHEGVKLNQDGLLSLAGAFLECSLRLAEA